MWIATMCMPCWLISAADTWPCGLLLQGLTLFELPAELAISQCHLLVQVLALPGIAGLHVMPLTQRARSQTAQLLQEGVLPS